MGPSLRLLLLALVLLAIPAVLTVMLLSGSVRSAVRGGSQPGGLVHGRLVAAGDAPAGLSLAGVGVELVGIAPDGAARALAQARSDEDGQFLIDAPAFEGHYELRTEAGAWLPARQGLSLLDRRDEGELALRLRPAAGLRVEFTRRDGRAVRGGRWTLTADAGGSWLSAWRDDTVVQRGAFEGASLRATAVPPGRVRLEVRLDAGERVDLVLDLAPGPNQHTVEI